MNLYSLLSYLLSLTEISSKYIHYVCVTIHEFGNCKHRLANDITELFCE